MLTRVSHRVIFLISGIVGIIAGMILIGGGLLYGGSSHTIYYQQVRSGAFRVIVINTGTYAFQRVGTDIYYIVDPQKFSPHISDTLLRKHQPILELIYKDEARPLQLDLDNVQISSRAYDVEQFALADKKLWKRQRYTSSEYTQNPDEFYLNNWPQGSIVAGVGVLFMIFFSIWSLIGGRSQVSTKQVPAAVLQRENASPPVFMHAPDSGPSYQHSPPQISQAGQPYTVEPHSNPGYEVFDQETRLSIPITPPLLDQTVPDQETRLSIPITPPLLDQTVPDQETRLSIPTPSPMLDQPVPDQET